MAEPAVDSQEPITEVITDHNQTNKIQKPNNNNSKPQFWKITKGQMEPFCSHKVIVQRETARRVLVTSACPYWFYFP